MSAAAAASSTIWPAPWDADPQVLSPVGRALDAWLTPQPRRQALEGFEPVYCDIVDYILRCTHRIWEEKNVGLCRTHYADSCVMHTLNGPAQGLDAVVQGTVGTLAAYADRIVVGEDVVWSQDAPGLFHSSHRIISRSTHAGDDPQFGPATGRVTGVTTVADCLVRENLIVEEWLVRDNARAALQLGHDPRRLAAAQATADRAGDPARHAWRADWIAAVRDAAPSAPPDDHPAAIPARALRLALSEDLYGEAAEACSPAVETRWPTNRCGWGRGYWIGCLMQLRGLLHGARLRLDHWCARPLPHGDVAVALRWSLAGVHGGPGPWGAPTGRGVLVLAASHFRLRGGQIVEDVTVFDELAVLRQVAGGLGAAPPKTDRPADVERVVAEGGAQP